MGIVYGLLYGILLVAPALIVQFGPDQYLTKIGKESKNSTVNLFFAIFGTIIFLPYFELLYGVYLIRDNLFMFLFPIIFLAFTIILDFISYSKLKGKENRFFLAVNDQVNNHKNYSIERSIFKNVFNGVPALTHVYNSDIEYLLRVGKRNAIIPESVKIVDGVDIYE